MATMNLKTFRAPSMAQCLADVKKDLGKDAVILHTRSYRVGAGMGIGGRQIMEISAADEVSARGPWIRASRPVSAVAGVGGGGGGGGGGFTPDAFPVLGKGATAVAEPPASRFDPSD